MKEPIKTPHALALLAASVLIFIFILGSTSLQPEPGSQVAQVAQTATLTLSPATNSAPVNTTFDVNIVLNTGGQPIYGVDINSLRFNPSMLQVVDANASEAGVQITPGTLMPIVFTNTANNTQGTVQFSQVANPGSTYTGSGTLATIKFLVKAAGTSNVTIDFTTGSGTDSNVAGAGGDILTSVGSGTNNAGAPDTTAPTAPGTPVLTVISSTQINLTWPVSTDAVGVTGYRVERCAGATCTTFAQIATPATASFSNSGLTASTVYRYRVRATDASGNLSAYSAISNATTLPPPDTTAPTISNIVLSGITTTGATISWNTNEPANTQVDYGLTTSYGASSALNSTMSATHSVSLTGLSAGRSYHYRVKSRDAAGNLTSSSDNVFTTLSGPDTTPPSVPAGLTVTPTGETKIQLSWNASTDPTVIGQDTSGVVSYEIYRGGVLLSTSATTAYLDTGLSGGTAYSYQIAAVDKDGNTSAKSASVVGTTPTLSLEVQRRVILVLQGTPATKRNVAGAIEFLKTTDDTKVFTSNISTDSFGRYTMSVPSGLVSTVNMRAIVPGYLAKKVSNIDLRDSAVIDIVFPELLAGNFVSTDQLINSLDYSYMNEKWGTSDALADINKDGVVNTLDYSYMSNNWTLVGE